MRFGDAQGERRAEGSYLDWDLAERLSGSVVGGISPLGLRRELDTVIDLSAKVWQTVFVSAGRRGLEVELAPDALATLPRARFAPLARAGPR